MIDSTNIYSKIFYSSLFILLFVCIGCWETVEPEEIELCDGRALNYDGYGHYVQMPFDVIPHKKLYKIGDTMSINFEVSKHVFDENLEETLEMIDFPFVPFFHLFRFEKTLPFGSLEAIYNGLGMNTVNIDEVNMPRIINTGFQGKAYRVDFDFDDEYYNFNFDVIFETEGNYLFLIRDGVNSYEATNDSLDASIINFPVENKCEGFRYIIKYILNGEDYLTSFRKEIKYLDEELWSNSLYSTNDTHYSNGNNLWNLESMGAFAFEVEE